MAQETPKTREPDVLDRDATADAAPAAHNAVEDAAGLPTLDPPAEPAGADPPGAEAATDAPPVLDDDEAASLLEVMLDPAREDSGNTTAPEQSAAEGETHGSGPAAEVDPDADKVANLNALMDEPLDEARPAGPPTDPAPGTEPTASAQAIAEERPEPAATPETETADETVTQAAVDAPPALDTEQPSIAGVASVTDDAVPHDLDAELEALLNEQAIDPEVLDAAGQIAAQDAELAEQNREALEQRAAEAALALDAAQTGNAEAPADNDEPATPTPQAVEPVAAVQPDSDLPDDQSLVAEIDSLLAAELEAPAKAAEEAAPETGESAADVPDPTIDQIDQMLAMEAEDDDDLIGEFFSSDDVISGITPGTGEAYLASDEAESEKETANKPSPATQPEPAATATPTPEEAAPGKRLNIDWRRVLAVADRLSLRLCWLLNWPARRYLSSEWRATLGYLALLQVGGAAAVWLLLVIL